MSFDYTLYPGRKLEEKYFENDLKNPKISIITAFYNDDKYLMETANSVLNQTFPFFEWIIVDDGSSNEDALLKLKVIEKMDERIRVIHKKNEGASVARDYGANNASDTSEYILFLDSDDLINKTYLECAYWTLETNKEASWAYTDSVNFGDREFIWAKYYTPELEMMDNILVITALIRKKDFFEVGGFGEKEKDIYEDWGLWLKMIKAGMFPVRMNYIGFWYRKKVGDNSQLNRANKDRNKIIKNYIKKITETIKNPKDGIQYPKQDYEWQKIIEKQEEIIDIKEKENEKIKILCIIPWMVVGGADKFNLDIISKCDKNKFEFIVLSTEPNENPWRQQFEENATVYDLTTFIDRKNWISFINYIIEKNNINLIFTSNSTFGYSAIQYIKSNYPEIPIIDYVHMEEWYNRNGGFSRDSGSVSNVIDKTLVCNKNSENILKRCFDKKDDETKTIYIGVDEKKFNPELFNKDEILSKFNIKKDKKYILGFICRIAEQKRPYLLIKIIKELNKIRDDFYVVVAGDGPMLEEIKNKVKEYNLENIVIFLGNISETEEIYTISDVTINCSIKEGLALTAYESLAMGVPVISSDVGGQKELITEEVGIIVPCMQEEKDIRDFNYKDEEIKLFVNGIQKILNNIEKYKEMCRKKILEGFTIDNMIKNMENIFEDTVKNPDEKKIENGKKLLANKEITKELITMYFEAYKAEYDWLSNKYTKENVGVFIPKRKRLRGKNNPLYEYTLEYKIKHPIVVVMRKIGIYNLVKKIFKRGEK